MLNGLDLFSGIGGITLALAPWVRPIAYCEIDRYAQGVLLSRMAEGQLPVAPIWDDIRTLGPHCLEVDSESRIDIIYGGFPCQDISVAGLGRGLAGERSGLFFEIARLVGNFRPSYVFLENVPAITARGGSEVVGTLAALGYDCRWSVAPSGHGLDGFRGNRWFFLAKTKSQRLEISGERRGIEKEKSFPASEMFSAGMDCERPTVESSICGTAYGLPYRVDRIKALGNAVVPLQARQAFKRLMGIA